MVVMRISDRQLAFKALCVLSEAAESAHKEPIAGTLGVRLALAYLYATARSDNRKVYDEFWQTIQSKPEGQTEHISAYMRGTLADTCIKGMVRAHGFNPTPALFEAMSDSYRGKGSKARKQK